jgi:hypothetical protein
MTQRISLLVTVKAYPAISRRHGESVCVAGIRTDLAVPEWVRLWPIGFRDLPFSRRFAKYQEITVDVDRSRDSRPESYRPITDSLTLGKIIGSDHGWSHRERYVSPLVVESMCSVIKAQEADGTSLGVFRPSVVTDFVIEPESPDWKVNQQAVIAQPSLFVPDKTALRKIPYRFKYRYRCSTKDCPGHEQSIVDWEVGQAYLGWTAYDEAQRLERIRRKWLGELCGGDKDVHFFVGNQHQHPTSFLVLGVYYPPKQQSPSSEQLGLGLAEAPARTQ